MKRYIRYMILAAATCLLHSCYEDSLTTSGGSFNITLLDDPSDVQKRSLPADLSDELKKQFIICIEREDGRKAYNGDLGTYHTNAPALKPGQYAIQGTYGENKALAIDEPYYISEKETATIEANQTTDVTLLCTVGNALASFAFSDPDKLAETFTTYAFVTKVNGESVSCTADDGRNPYFREGSTVDFYLQGTTTDNKQIDYKFASISSAARQTNYKYTLTIGATAEGSANLDISVSTTVSSVTINETLPEEWLPKAKLSSEGFDETNTLNYRETTDASTTRINYQAVKPIEDVEMTLNFEDPQLSSLSKTYLFSELTVEERNQLIEAGMTLPELNTTSGSLDLTSMTSGLLCTNDGNTAVNKINIRVKANNRWSDTKEYTINTLRPEFNIVVNEGDFWSKEFAIRDFNVTEGNLQKIKAQTSYQYSTDGGHTWISFNEGMKQKFSNHPEIKNYTVRALYRNVLASNTEEITLETPVQLPNSDMENWSTEDSGWDFPNYLPRSSVSEAEFWDTNNEFTFRYNIAIKTAYNGFPAVSYSTAYKHSGNRSAELRNTAAGPANTEGVWIIPSTIYDNNRVAGMLFAGNYTGTTSTAGADGSVSIDEGKSFSVRPTQLSFWYMYDPYNGNGQDTYEVIVKVFDTDGNVIGNGSHTSNQTMSIWTQQIVNINYTSEPVNKAAKIYILFQSSNAGLKNVPYGEREINLADYGNVKTPYGSVLRIDDISLIYDR